MALKIRSRIRLSGRKTRYFNFMDNERNEFGIWTGKDIYHDVLHAHRLRVFGFDTKDTSRQLRMLENEIKIRLRITSHEVFIIGELLSMAKQICTEKGIRFKLWIIKAFSFSYETANNFMNVYKYCLGHRTIAALLPLSLLYKIGAPNFPQELREYIFQTFSKLESITDSILKRMLEKYKAGGIEAVEKDIENYTTLTTAESQIFNCFDQAENTLRSLDSFHDSIVKWGNRQSYVVYDSQVQTMSPLVQEINNGILQAVESAINTVETAVASAEEKFKAYRKALGEAM
jgi:hypothetical protein